VRRAFICSAHCHRAVWCVRTNVLLPSSRERQVFGDVGAVTANVGVCSRLHGAITWADLIEVLCQVHVAKLMALR